MKSDIRADSYESALERIETLLRNRQAIPAQRAAMHLTAAGPGRAEGYLLLGRAFCMQGDFAAALEAADAAARRAPGHPAALMLSIECLLQSGERQRGIEELRRFEVGVAKHPGLSQDAGRLYAHLNLHVESERCYARAAALSPHDPQALYNWSTCLIALGRLEEAEQLLTRVIAISPGDQDAHYNRSTLRRQTAERNHIAELEVALRACGTPSRGIALGFALAKELEDVGRHADSFAVLKGAADGRRRVLSYRVGDDVAAMSEIARVFDAAYCARAATEAAPDRLHTQDPLQTQDPLHTHDTVRAHDPVRTHDAVRTHDPVRTHETLGTQDPRNRPLIFIVGLPRSGTTLVDRILSSHSRVQSRGESGDLAAGVMQLAGRARDKTALIRQAAAVDAAELGRNYCARLPPDSGQWLIDKTPMNFLYLGLIARALPSARIIHVRRHAYDVCYAMYKTLFRMAYPFSYSLEDLAEYYLGYAALMRHWQGALGERIVHIDYEDLVADQVSATRRLLAACDLPWEEGCLEFHRNKAASLTASAAQVREPIYNSSVGLWRRYERELQPLIARLVRDPKAAAL
jgi:tetratricopeptide (TPR) repeat protein